MMLHGTVTYVMKHDPQSKDVKIDWAAKAEFDDGQEGPKMRYYQVYLVASPSFPLITSVLFRTNAGGIGYCCSTGCCCRCAEIIDT